MYFVHYCSTCFVLPAANSVKVLPGMLLFFTEYAVFTGHLLDHSYKFAVLWKTNIQIAAALSRCFEASLSKKVDHH